MGDSAGGGLGLSYAMTIKDSAIKQPSKLILYSPWLDVSMTNPAIDEYVDTDYILDKKALIEAAKSYVGDGELTDPRVSPIYGDFEGLGEILMFFGTHEMFYGDALKLQEILNSEEYDIRFSFYPEMQHVWILGPIEETELTLQETYDFILKNE